MEEWGGKKVLRWGVARLAREKKKKKRRRKKREEITKWSHALKVKTLRLRVRTDS